MKRELEKLRRLLAEVYHIEASAYVLEWDEATYMPPEGAEARARQIAILQRLAHEKLTDPAIGDLLDRLGPFGESLPYDSDNASLIRVTRREYERAVRVPSDFIERFKRHTSSSYESWTRARPSNDFSAVKPFLKKTIELSRQFADFFPGYEHIADPLINSVDYGMTVATIRTLFHQLRNQLLPLVKKVIALPAPDATCLRKHYPEKRQLEFCREVVESFGYDMNRGRIDRTPHPFTIHFSIRDVRITTRVKENDLREALFSTMHEAGHALYVQGISKSFEASPLGRGTSAAVHESQSRLWENIVGRSLPFWRFFYPRLQAAFPDQLRSLPVEDFYRAINKVEPSLIRTDADELTYNLHVIIRFELELELLEQKISVDDLQEAWNERYRGYLGITPPDDRDGVLQDAHWYHGTVGGAFQGYTLGNILNAQFYEKALQDHPEITKEMEGGNISTLLGWLKERIYRHGSKFTTTELVQRVTGKKISIEPYMRYLKKKYGELYGI